MTGICTKTRLGLSGKVSYISIVCCLEHVLIACKPSEKSYATNRYVVLIYPEKKSLSFYKSLYPVSICRRFLGKMWPVIMGFMRTYAVYITFPVAAVIGVIGYNVEGYIRKDKNTPWKMTGIKEEREERKLGEIDGKDCTDVTALKSRQDFPKTILDRNDFPKQR